MISGCIGKSESKKPAFVSSSPAFESGDTLPSQFTCEGTGKSPPFIVNRIPEPTKSLAITAEWSKGPINEPRFWTIWNIPPETERIPVGIPRTKRVESLGGARQGRQRGGTVGYKPPCPPSGQSYEHRFQIYALDQMLDAPAGTTNEEASEAIGSSELASNRITLTYTRSTADG